MKRFSGITTTQLARICGVSQGTVDRALHGRDGISEKTKEKILAIAREYEYVPRVKGAADNRSMLIGVVLFDLYNEFFSKLAMSLTEQAREFGYSVIFLFSNKDIKEEKAAIDYFNCIGVDGIVLFSVGSDDTAYQNYLHSIKKLIVTVGNRLFDLPYIGIDDRQAMYDLTKKMLSETRSDEIAYFAPILKKDIHKDNAQRLRLAGFQEAMAESGRSYRVLLDENDISDQAKVIICSTDHYVLRVLNRIGLSSEVHLAGFDNISALRNIRRGIMTTEYSTEKIAKECMNYFLKRNYCAKIAHRIVH